MSGEESLLSLNEKGGINLVNIYQQQQREGGFIIICCKGTHPALSHLRSNMVRRDDSHTNNYRQHDDEQGGEEEVVVLSPTSVIPVGPAEDVKPISLSLPSMKSGTATTTAKGTTTEFSSSSSSSSLSSSSSPTSSSWPTLIPSAKSLRTKNPIREIVDPIVASLKDSPPRDDHKGLISLALGDPTAFGNFAPCPALTSMTNPAIVATAGAGYINALGTEAARQAIAAHHSSNSNGAGVQYEADDVIIASGCSGTLDIILTALLDPGTILLVPQPGFPLYEVIARAHGATVQYYRLLPDKAWKVDLHHVAELVEHFGNTIRGIVINNPSNPTGAVHSQHHLREILQTCHDCHLPIVADEIYGELVFGQHQFFPLAHVAASLRDCHVPVITCSGLAKQYLLPGWRVGWALFYDNQFGSLAPIVAGAKRLAQIVLGASHLPQTAVPALLDSSNQEIVQWKRDLRLTLEEQASYIANRLSQIPGFTVLPSGGAMYMMVRLERKMFDASLYDDQVFCRALLKEENVFVLPGTCFGFPNAFRVVFSAPLTLLGQAADRMEAFCERHRRVD